MIWGWFFGRKKKEEGEILAALIQKLNQDFFSRELLNEFNALGIRLKVSNRKCKFTMGSSFYYRKVTIPIREAKKFLSGEIDQKLFAAAISHELGHFLSLACDENAAEDAIKARLRGRSCGIRNNCLYEELLAAKLGVEFLKELGMENLRPVEVPLYLCAFGQCGHCLYIFGSEKTANCPKEDDLKKLKEEIENSLSSKNP